MAYVYTKSFAAQSTIQTLTPQSTSLVTFSSSSITLAQIAEQLRWEASHQLALKPTLGQVLTPGSVARLIASLLENTDGAVRLLDAGAGTGMLFVEAVNHLLSRPLLPRAISITAYEIDPAVAAYARRAMSACEQACVAIGVSFAGRVIERDFIEDAPALTGNDLFGESLNEPFTHAILNPPYFKIHGRSRERRLLHRAGIETTNIYTGFLEVAMRLLSPGGQLIAITPRSFCNGVYFANFRKALLETMSLRYLHLFGSRLAVFNDATTEKETLQETMIFAACKRSLVGDTHFKRPVRIASSDGPDDPPEVRDVDYEQIVVPGDPKRFIRITASGMDAQVATLMRKFPCSLDDLGLSVSTGRVVDFRARAYLRNEAQPEDAPLIYPAHLAHGFVKWPLIPARKPNALHVASATTPLLIPNETYPLVKRFTSKEERRRVVATLYSKGSSSGRWLGIENHLNYFHRDGHGLEINLARGLTAFLNSTLVDTYFRQFSGHTQVNATDLRSLRYPTHEQLTRLGWRIGAQHHSQSSLDALMREELFPMSDDQASDPAKIKQRIGEALEVLKALGFPRAQQNERSALTLLALIDINPAASWEDATASLRGITQLMDFFARNYGKTYAPNSRETVRRQTVHQFLDAGLIRINPDDPSRPTNSGQTVYQIEENALALLKTFGSAQWQDTLTHYRSLVPTLKERYAQERFMARIPLRLAAGKSLALSPGGQNLLIERIVHDFAERFTPDGDLVYIGDAKQKFGYFDEYLLAALGVHVNPHGKMPDVVIYSKSQGILLLIEAVTSHGPISAQRKSDLAQLFGASTAPLTFVTAFMTRRMLAKYVHDIAWETYVWLAETPSHVIHFNGEQFSQPQL